jgi:hypothetical protein
LSSGRDIALGGAPVDLKSMAIAFALLLLALIALSPWLAVETRPGFDERSDDERFGTLH